MSRRATLLALAAGLAGIVIVAPSAGARAETPSFERLPLALAQRALLDVGAVDYDGDNDIDLFSTNHNARSSLLENDGSGEFDERVVAEGLAHTLRFPSWELIGTPPDLSERGVYIYWPAPGRVLVRFVAPPNGAALRLRFLSAVRVADVDGPARVSRTVTRVRRVVRIEAHGPASVALRPEVVGAPVGVDVGPRLEENEIFIGAAGQQSTLREVKLLLRDRHGIAWSDLAGSAALDGYVVRGGIQGNRILAKRVSDELLVQGLRGLENEAPALGVRKRRCRGREAATLDFNRDGRLDLFSGCVGAPPLLQRKRPQGDFEKVHGLRAAGVRGAPEERGVGFRWAEITGRAPAELLAARSRRIEVYAHGSRGWYRRQSVGSRHDGQLEGLAPADFDGDGDVDVLAVTASGSTLLRNAGGRLRPSNPGNLGLPFGSRSGAWVDVNNDGRLDLHTLPQGVFLQRPNGRFDRTGAADVPAGVDEARVVWPDLDGDGARDGVMVWRDLDQSGRRSMRILRNTGAAGHWLAVDLNGPAGNRQAIGARVQVSAAGRTQTAWVGASESARYSQGLYRLYFGLGDQSSAAVAVRWPDGSSEKLPAVPADQLVELSQ